MDYAEMRKLMDKQKVEMTESERLKAYNNGEEVDYLPFKLYAPDLVFANIFGYSTSEFGKNVEVKCDVIQKVKNEFGFYSSNFGLGLKTIGAALGSKSIVPENGIDYVEEHVLKNYDDLERLELTDPYNNPVLTPILESAKVIKDRFPDITISTSVAGPFSTAISIRRIESILRDTKKDPENLHKLLQLTVDCSLKWVEAFYNEFGSVGINITDPVTSINILSYDQFKQHSYSYFKKLVDGIIDIMGAPPSAHICGRTSPIWNDLVDIGIKSFSVDNCEDLEHIKNEVGDKMMISGNVPPVDVMRNGSIDDVIKSCKLCIGKGADSPMGFVLSTGCQIPIGTPRENVEAFIYAARKYGRLAKKGELPQGILDEM